MKSASANITWVLPSKYSLAAEIQICFFSLFVLSSVLTWQRSSLRVVLFTYCGNVLNYKLKYPNKKTSAELYLFVYDEKPGIHFLLFAVVFQYTLEGFTFLIIVHWEHISLLNADCIFMFLQKRTLCLVSHNKTVDNVVFIF